MFSRPVTVTAAAALEAAEAAAALGFGVFVAWETVAGTPLDRATAWAVAGMALLGAVCMGLVARGLLTGERWSRSPVVLTQLFALPVAWSLLQSEQYAYGVPLVVVAIATLVLVLSGPSTAWLMRDEDEQDELPEPDELPEQEQLPEQRTSDGPATGGAAADKEG